MSLRAGNTAPAAGLPTPGTVAGSLGGDPRVVTAVLRVAWNDLLSRVAGPSGVGGRLVPATAHVRMVQRADDGLIVGEVGATRADGRFGWEVFVVGPDIDHLYASSAVAAPEGSGGAALQQGGAFINQVTECGRTNVIVIAPPGSTGTMTRIGGTPVALPLRPDGVAVFAAPLHRAQVRVERDRQDLGALTVGP